LANKPAQAKDNFVSQVTFILRVLIFDNSVIITEINKLKQFPLTLKLWFFAVDNSIAT